MIVLNSQNIIIIVFTIGFLIEIYEYIKLFFKLSFLYKFEQELNNLNKNFGNKNLEEALLNIQFLSRNLLKYKSIVKRELFTDNHINALEMCIFNFYKFYIHEWNFNKEDFFNSIFAISCNTEVEIGDIKEKFKKIYRLFNPLVYVHNTFKLVTNILLSVFPSFPMNWSRKLITLFSELIAVMSYFETYHPELSKNILSKIDFFDKFN